MGHVCRVVTPICDTLLVTSRITKTRHRDPISFVPMHKCRSLEFFTGCMLNNALLNLRELDLRYSDATDKLGFALKHKK